MNQPRFSIEQFSWLKLDWVWETQKAVGQDESSPNMEILKHHFQSVWNLTDCLEICSVLFGACVS